MSDFVKILPIDPAGSYKFVVLFSRYQNKWLFSRHKDRSTWETQGGHIEPGETPEAAAKRELFEESGAKEFRVTPVCAYQVGEDAHNNGVVYLAQIETLGPLPQSEMAETRLFDALPENPTYPQITPVLFEEIKKAIDLIQ